MSFLQIACSNHDIFAGRHSGSKYAVFDHRYTAFVAKIYDSRACWSSVWRLIGYRSIAG
jgi:hypothetical protein